MVLVLGRFFAQAEEPAAPMCASGAIRGRNVTVEHVVEVWGKPHVILVYPKSRGFWRPRSVWIAAGNYLGESIEVTASSEGSAIERWRDIARYRRN
jgi:hypothetical protein